MVVGLQDEDNRGDTSDVSLDNVAEHRNVISAPERTVDEHFSDVPAEVHGADAGYSPLQRRLHWIVAALVALQLVLGLFIGTMDRQTPNNSLLRTILIVHLVTGTVIFGLMCRRLSLRRQLGAPPSPEGTPLDATVLARSNHLGFYVLLLALPVLGWLAYLSGSSAAAATWGAIHGALALVLVLAIFAHLGGVVFHQYIRRDGLLRRMLG